MKYKYTNEDIEFLKINYPIGNWKEIHEHFPNLSDSSIHHKCSRMGIKFINDYKGKFNGTQQRKKWSKDEIEILKNSYSSNDMDTVISFFNGRNKNSIISKANKLGLTSYKVLNSMWEKEDEQYIIDNWKLKPDILIAQELNRTFRSVKWKREELGLYRQDMASYSYPTLSKYLRGKNQKWKVDSMKQCAYKCILTGTKNFQIHHLYGVSNIISDVLNKYVTYNILSENA